MFVCVLSTMRFPSICCHCLQLPSISIDSPPPSLTFRSGAPFALLLACRGPQFYPSIFWGGGLGYCFGYGFPGLWVFLCFVLHPGARAASACSSVACDLTPPPLGGLPPCVIVLGDLMGGVYRQTRPKSLCPPTEAS